MTKKIIEDYKKKGNVIKKKSKIRIKTKKTIPTKLKNGKLIIENYTTIELIDQSAHSLIFLGVENTTNERAIIKMMPITERSKSEISLHYRLKGNGARNVADILEIYKTDKIFILILRYYENRDLHSFMITEGFPLTRFSEEDLKYFGKQICTAIASCHKNNICHLDIKPANIFIGSNNDVYLGDFGNGIYSRYKHIDNDVDMLLNSSNNNQLLTTYPDYLISNDPTSNNHCGTAEYNDIKVLRCKGYNPYYADIWSLGVTFFVLLTKTFPFTDSTRRLINSNKAFKASKQYKFSKLFNKNNFSQDCYNLLYSLLHKNPRKRPTIFQVLNHPFFQNIDSPVNNNNSDQDDNNNNNNLVISNL
eukprot:TRINITY_DN594_c0_g1_i1.p1 TRINITY_DN594_c0_g1~~TRINITY_DN594_c0_g1_i1.p1  ORF type:complete len:362 (+),score=52.03 TRINITY_DN594_c0_g1_i1:163-1248(+)